MTLTFIQNSNNNGDGDQNNNINCYFLNSDKQSLPYSYFSYIDSNFIKECITKGKGRDSDFSLYNNIKYTIADIKNNKIVKNPYVENFKNDILSKRYNIYFLHGRAGVGKSTFLIQTLLECFEYEKTYYLRMEDSIEESQILSWLNNDSDKLEEALLFIDSPAENIENFKKILRFSQEYKKLSLKIICCERSSRLEDIKKYISGGNLKNTLDIELNPLKSEEDSYSFDEEFQKQVIKSIFLDKIQEELIEEYCSKLKNRTFVEIILILGYYIGNQDLLTGFKNVDFRYPWLEWEENYTGTKLEPLFKYIASYQIYNMPFPIDLAVRLLDINLIELQNQLDSIRKRSSFLCYNDETRTLSFRWIMWAKFYYRLEDEFGWYDNLHDILATNNLSNQEIIEFEKNIFSHINILEAHNIGKLKKFYMLFKELKDNEHYMSAIERGGRTESVDLANLYFSEYLGTVTYEEYQNLLIKYPLSRRGVTRYTEYLKQAKKTESNLLSEENLINYLKEHQSEFGDNWIKILTKIARGYAESNRIKEALSLYEEIIERNPNDCISRLECAKLMRQEPSKVKQAYGYLQEAKEIAIKMNNKQSLRNIYMELITLYKKYKYLDISKNDKEKRIEKIFEEVKKFGIESLLFDVEKCKILKKKSKYKECFDLLYNLSDIYPNNDRIQKLKAEFYSDFKNIKYFDKEKAQELYNELLRWGTSKRSMVSNLIRYGTFLQAIGELNEAYEKFVCALFLQVSYRAHKDKKITINDLDFQRKLKNFRKQDMKVVMKKDYIPPIRSLKDDVSRIKRRIIQINLERSTDKRCKEYNVSNPTKEIVKKNIQCLQKNRKLKNIQLLELYQYYSTQQEKHLDWQFYSIYKFLLEFNDVSQEERKNRTKIIGTKIAIMRIQQSCTEDINKMLYLKTTRQIYDILTHSWTDADVKKKRIKKKSRN